MKSALLASVFDSIENFLASIADALQFDVILYIFIGLLALLVIMTAIRLRFTYEVRAIKSFKKINKYFLKKPYINESNLVEFNRLMKKIPYQLRDRWQYFMLNREGLPSSYMTLYHCVEQPIKTSSYRSTIVMLKYITNICVVLCAMLCLFLSATSLTGRALVQALIIPMAFFILSQLYIYFLNARFNTASIDLYEYYLAFIRNLDKASASIPDYVDYELLFTDKEIRDGIPVLREYLEKRALLDKIAREKAKQNESERESFDFTNLGIDGSLLVERAMTTSQDYLNTRNRLKDEIAKLEKEKEKYDSQYVAIEKDSQRKLQTIKENLDRLQAQLDASANRIEANYIKKQQGQERAKQTEIEKNLEDLHVKYAQQVQFLEAEIEKRKKEIEEDKKEVSEQMDAEFTTYNEKVYTILRNKIDQDDADELKITRAELDSTRDKLASETQEKDNLQITLEIRGQEIDTMQSKIDALNDKIAKLSSRDKRNISKMYDENISLKQRVEELESQIQNTPVATQEIVEGETQEAHQEPEVQEQADEEAYDEPIYYDADHNVVDFSQYYDENGWFKEFPKVYDKDGNYYDFADYYDKYGNPLDEGGENAEVEEQLASAEEQQSQETTLADTEKDSADGLSEVEQPIEQGQKETEASPQDQTAMQVESEKSTDETATESNEPVIQTDDKTQEVVNENASEEQEDSEIVYYDKDGKPVDFEKFYDEDGRFKEFPKVYDKDGNYYDFADYYDRDGNLLEGYQEVNESEIIPITEDEQSEVIVDDIQSKEPQNKDAKPQDEPQPEKRKRGRPKKVQTEGSADASADDKKVKTKKRRATRVADEDKEGSAVAGKTAKKDELAKQSKDTDTKKAVVSKTKTSTSKTTKTKSTGTKKVADANKTPKIAEEKAKTTKAGTKSTGTKSTSTKKAGTKTAGTKSTTTKSKATKTTKAKTIGTKSTSTKSAGAKSAKANIENENKQVKEKTSKNSSTKKEKPIDELEQLTGQINTENAILEQKQADLKNKISQTLSELQEKPTVDRDLEEIKEIMNRLKEQATEAKKNGISKEEQQQINKSLIELLHAMANKTSKK